MGNDQANIISFSTGPLSFDRPLLSMREVDENRNLSCPSYDVCLDLVVGQGWRGWTCAACPRLLERPDTSTEAATDAAYDELIIDTVKE